MGHLALEFADVFGIVLTPCAVEQTARRDLIAADGTRTTQGQRDGSIIVDERDAGFAGLPSGFRGHVEAAAVGR
jgi:hypothetical protein